MTISGKLVGPLKRTSPATVAKTTTIKTKATRDSDSGHGRTSSSASSISVDVACQDGADKYNQNEECFVDASDADFEPNNKDDGACCRRPQTATGESQHGDDESERAELKVRLEETTVVLRMALNNEFIGALEICGRRAHTELYASLANATLSFLRAALTLEPGDLQAALASIQQSFDVSADKRRKTSTASMVMRFLYRPNYNTYTDDQIHAELVHAESLLLLALISFLSDQSIICLVKGAFRIRACYQRYKECMYIMENRREWASEEARKHFESGVRMGHGIFNLLMSYLPRRVLRFLEYVGFSGNRTVGLEELDKSVALQDGLRSVFSALVILTYHCYLENLFGLGAYDPNKVEELNNSFLGNYPNSAFFLLFRGRYHQMQGHLSEAINSFQQCIAAQDDWKQFHSICHWEIMWCYAFQMDWNQAAHYSDLLRKQSKWSPASYTYQYATFLYASLVEDERHGLCQVDSKEYATRMSEIRQIMERIPDLRIRYAGKTIPAEKFAIARAAKFCRQQNRLTLPALEFLYIWNIFTTLKNNPQQVERLLVKIDSEIEHINKIKDELEIVRGKSTKNGEDQSGGDNGREESSEEEDDDDEEGDNWDDDLALVLLLKAMCLKHLKRIQEAEEIFAKIIDMESSIRTDTYLVPHTAMELAVLKLDQEQYESARQLVKMARNNYTGYLLETIVHFRLHAASRVIRLEYQGRNLTSSFDSTSDVSSKLADQQQQVSPPSSSITNIIETPPLGS